MYNHDNKISKVGFRDETTSPGAGWSFVFMSLLGQNFMFSLSICQDHQKKVRVTSSDQVRFFYRGRFIIGLSNAI